MTGKYQPNGYLYVPSYDKTGIYKINLSNSTDITLISLADGDYGGLCQSFFLIIRFDFKG